MREQAKKDAEKRAKRPEAIQAASVQHDLLQLLERARQIQPEPFKVTNGIRCAQNKVSPLYAYVHCGCTWHIMPLQWACLRESNLKSTDYIGIFKSAAFLSLSLSLSLPAPLMAKRPLNDSVGAKQIKVMLADDGNDDALSIFLASIQVIQLQTDLGQVLGNDSLLSVT